MFPRFGKSSAELSRKSIRRSIRFADEIPRYIESRENRISAKLKKEKKGIYFREALDVKTFIRSAIIFVRRRTLSGIELNYPRMLSPLIFFPPVLAQKTLRFNLTFSRI